MRILYAMLFALAVCSNSVRANIVNVTGDVVLATPPTDISEGNWESDTQIRAFAEQQNVTLQQGLTVDISQPGESDATNPNLSTATIPAGTVVDSYLVHFDPVGQPTSRVSLSGSLTFDEPILGVIALGDSLDDSDAAVGLPSVTTYSSGPGRGLEFVQEDDNDSLTLGAYQSGLQTVTCGLRSTTSVDEFRVITAVPEPAVLAPAVLALCLMKRRRAHFHF